MKRCRCIGIVFVAFAFFCLLLAQEKNLRFTGENNKLLQTSFILDYDLIKPENPKPHYFIPYSRYTLNYFRIRPEDPFGWDGKHWQASDFPLKVFIEKPHSPYFNKKFINYVFYAFNVWNRVDERIKFSLVKNRDSANIIFRFETDLAEEYDLDYLGLTESNFDFYKIFSTAVIKISLLKNGNRIIQDGQIKDIIIHELGHALGMGHSANPNDLMYFKINPFADSEMYYNELSKGDVDAMKSLINFTYKKTVFERSFIFPLIYF